MKYSVIIPYYDSPELRFALDSYAYYYGPRKDTEIIIVEAYENYYSEHLHTQLLSLIDRYKDAIKIQIIVDPVGGILLPNSYLLGAKVATGELIMLTTSFTIPNFDFFKNIEKENLGNTCVVCGCASVRVLEDRGTFFNSDFGFGQWYQHTQHINRVHNFCCILNKQIYLDLGNFGKVNFFKEFENRGVTIWTRDDLYVYIINDKAGTMDFIKSITDNILDTDKVLDIGCGDKAITRNLKKENVVSLDAWDKVNPDICIDISKENLPFEENSFDVILMIDFIEHIEKKRGIELLEECKKITRKKIIVYTPLFWTDNALNVNNPDLWCYGNEFDYHKSLWEDKDFDGWQRIPYNDYYLGIWNKPTNNT